MTCQYCGADNAAADDDAANGVSPSSPYCPTCQPLMREAFALLLAGLADLFAAHREQQEVAERKTAA